MDVVRHAWYEMHARQTAKQLGLVYIHCHFCTVVRLINSPIYAIALIFSWSNRAMINFTNLYMRGYKGSITGT
jgi:predicted metallopeptidase